MSGINKKGVKGFSTVEEGGVHTGTEAWNIAQYFTGYSIALPLKDLNDLEDIAMFGSVRMDEDLLMSDDQFTKRRADAVKRYWQKLRQIVSDTLFKVKSKDKKEAEEIETWLKEIPKYFNGLLDSKTDLDHTESLVVNEKFLILLLDKLVANKQQYLYILDRAGLIFKQGDDFDADAFAKDFVGGG